MGILQAVLGAMSLITAWFGYLFVKDYLANKEAEISKKTYTANLGVGFATTFFDALGIGNFATSTALFKIFGLCRDKKIPGTLNVGYTVTVVMEALIFITIIKVDVLTLLLLIASASIGAFLGAGIVSRLPEKKVQVGMGIALLVAAFFMLAGKFGWMPGGGEAIGLTGGKLIVGIVVNFILGALMTLGIGLYAPCMALIYALGMSPKVAFPIMMGSCAFLMPVAGFKFIKEGAYERKTAMALTIAGIPAIIIAAYIVKSLPLSVLTWVIICVIIYTAIAMLRSAMKPVAITEPAAIQEKA